MIRNGSETDIFYVVTIWPHNMVVVLIVKLILSYVYTGLVCVVFVWVCVVLGFI